MKKSCRLGILSIIILMFAVLICAKNTNSVEAAGVQNAIFPMEYLCVSNTGHPNNEIRKAVDFSGKDAGIDNVFAPFDGTIVDIKNAKWNEGNTVILQSNFPVRFANGVIDYMCVSFTHDNDISDLYIGKQVSQKEVFYQEGNYGIGAGNHLHMICSQGRYNQETTWEWWYSGHLTNNLWTDQALFYLNNYTIITKPGPFEYWRPAPVQETTPPTITDLKYSEFSPNQFTISSHVTDASGIKEVKYAVWTLKEDGSGNNQDDLVWHEGHHTDNNNVFWAWIPFSDHKNERGTYLVHAYATDNAGNTSTAGATYYFEENPPVMSTPQIVDKDSTGYTITFKISDETGINRVQFPTWTLNNDRDDSVQDWENNPVVRGTVNGDTVTFRVEDKEHNYEKGTYTTHIYAYDTYGNRSGPVIVNVDLENTFVPAATVVDGSRKYLLFDDIVTWKDAKLHCEKLGGHLATITSEAEQKKVYSLTENRKRGSYYIGLTDEKQEGNFQWVTKESFSYQNWATGQPDNYGGNENYGVIYNEQNGLWNDFTNQNNRLGFICEIENAAITPIKLGDVDNDGSINASDSLTTLRHSVKEITLKNEQFTKADVNKDKIVNATDALQILRYSVKEIKQF